MNETFGWSKRDLDADRAFQEAVRQQQAERTAERERALLIQELHGRGDLRRYLVNCFATTLLSGGEAEFGDQIEIEVASRLLNDMRFRVTVDRLVHKAMEVIEACTKP